MLLSPFLDVDLNMPRKVWPIDDDDDDVIDVEGGDPVMVVVAVVDRETVPAVVEGGDEAGDVDVDNDDDG